MRVYYLNEEYEAGKHKIVKVWSEYVDRAMPEDSPKTAINVPYSVLELDERHNRWLARQLLTNTIPSPEGDIQLADKYYVDNSGVLRDEFDNLATINPNPQKATYKLSVFAGATPEQIDTYINNNVTNIATAREYLKKLTRVAQLLLKENRFED